MPAAAGWSIAWPDASHRSQARLLYPVGQKG